jgi:hypothetical protein
VDSNPKRKQSVVRAIVREAYKFKLITSINNSLISFVVVPSGRVVKSLEKFAFIFSTTHPAPKQLPVVNIHNVEG